VPDWELAQVLEPLKGKVVMTNIFPTVVGFFTREATFGGCEEAAFPSSRRMNRVTNADLEMWSDDARPADWALGGDGMTARPDAADRRNGERSALLTITGGAPGQFRQRVSLPRQAERYRIVATFWVKATAPQRVRLYVMGPEPEFSAFHSGGGTWEMMSVEATFPTSVIRPPNLEVGIQMEPGVPISVNADSASLNVLPLGELDGMDRSARNSAMSGKGRRSMEANAHSDDVDASKCHAVWIRGYGSETTPRPTHYVLFRNLFTGFTLCREPECLDRMENHLSARFPKILTSRLCTVFALTWTDQSGERR
jgi:hypothetical protein